MLSTSGRSTRSSTRLEQAGSSDVSFNVIGYGDVQKPLSEISVEDFLRPITTAMRTQFLTTRAATRHMVCRRSGVILHFGGTGRRLCRVWVVSRSPSTGSRACDANGRSSSASMASES
jgi:NAD(P)-dependent dehydrogenase (short-subunit alcohol dehydrogenase family)